MDKQLIMLMRQFNFNQISATIYSLLLIDGPLSMKHLEEQFSTCHSQAKHALKQLISLHLISIDHQRNQLYYYATDPSITWLALATDLVWAVNDKPEPITNLPETDNQNIEGLRILCNEIGSLAQSLYKPYIAALQHRERDVKNLEELAQLTCEAISQAQKQIIAVNKSPRLPQVSSFWTVLTQRIEKGVRYCRIVDLDEIIDHGLSIVLRDIEVYNIDLRILERTQLTHSFYMIDKKLLSIFSIPFEASDSAHSNVGRITSQYQIITRYRKHFNQYYTNSIPARFVIARMREAAEHLLTDASNRLSPTELLWLESLIEFGKFSRFHIKKNWSNKQFSLVERKAIAAGLVHRTADGHIVPTYSITEANLRAVYIPLQ